MSNKDKDRLLGEPHGTASAKLRKALLFKYVVKAGHDCCARCGLPIESVDEFSIEHTVSWRRADNPRAAFFDLNAIAFSHMRCNRPDVPANQNSGKTHCHMGHAFTPENTFRTRDGRRRCGECRRGERTKSHPAAG